MNATAISEDAIPALVEALRDPEVQVRANCAHALARLDVIPAAAIPLLIECTADANDGLRMNAARALKLAPADAVINVMQRLVADPNSRVRLIAASSLLVAEPGNTLAGAVLVESLEDPVLRVREAALVLLDSLGAQASWCSPSQCSRTAPPCRRASERMTMMERTPLAEDIQNYAQNIVDTVREPLLILDATLRVRSANRAFYQTFHVSPGGDRGPAHL